MNKILNSVQTKTIFISLVVLLTLIILVFQSCKKDENKTNQPPSCTITSPTNGQQLARGEIVTITVNADDVDGSIAEVRFFINDIEKGTTLNSPYKYIWNTSDEEFGNYTLRATSVDNKGDSKTDEISIGLINSPPTAIFTVSPTSGTTNTDFIFDANGCTDNETPTSQLQVRWDFDGNGSWDTDWNTNKIQNHQYSNEGTYSVKLEVKDADNYIGQGSTNIIVILGNTAPTASFSVSPSIGITTTNFAFDASDCSDNETPTDILQVRWDFDGNGSWDTNWDTAKIQSHQYGGIATYNAKLEVKDTEELISETAQIINVVDINLGSFTDPRDGQSYATVEIASQTWFAENLNFDIYDSWTYQFDPANGDIYGRLYPWEAALTACPNGWHLPSDDEWIQLEIILGMSESEVDAFGYRGVDQGAQMKSISGWHNYGNGTNSSGFNALPGGASDINMSFWDLGEGGYWWSSTEGSGASAWARYLSYEYHQVGRNGWNKTVGSSIRCLKN